MIFFKRDDLGVKRPKSLNPSRLRSVQAAIGEHMQLSPDRREQTDIPPIWKTPFEVDVLAALGAASDGNCAFCGLKASLSVYRFRPPAHAQPRKPPEGKESYLWLSFDWGNLFPICASCRPSNQNYFPVTGNRDAYQQSESTENAQLIYPGELDQPHRSFSIMQTGRFTGKTKRARATIEHFKLNAPEKVLGRRDSLQATLERVRQTGWDWGQAGEITRTGLGPWYLYLMRMAEKMCRNMRHKLPLTPGHIHQTMAQLALQPDYDTWFSQALVDIGAEDALVADIPVDSARVDIPAAPQAPRLASIDLTTYKSLEKITFDMAAELAPGTKARLHAGAATTGNIPEAPCVLILGENATGKSSILEAIALALMPTEHRNRLKLETSSLTLNPEYMGAPEASQVWHSNVDVIFHPAAQGEAARFVGLRIDGSANANVPFTETGERLAPLPPVFAYGAHRLYGSNKRRSSLRHIETLFHNDRQLPKPETWLCKLSDSDLDQVARALRHIIQIDGEFHTIEIDRDTKQCKINIEKTRPDGEVYIVPQQMDIVSSGYRAIFALVCDVLEGLTTHCKGNVSAARDVPAIVLIDEIEAHLHPRWKLQVITGLRRALPRVTFIITSHDPLCVRGMYDREVLALNRYQNTDYEGLGMPERVERVAGFENVETLTIEQLLTSELFQLLSTDNPEMERSLAHAADKLSRGDAEQAISSEVLEGLDQILAAALPYGQTELARIVQEAVADYLVERRGRDHDARDKARRKAKEEIKKRLRELMP